MKSILRFAQPFLFKMCMLCAYMSPRYQVSVYRTIVPLVFSFHLFVVVVVLDWGSLGPNL